jgi:hypothetical protein
MTAVHNLAITPQISNAAYKKYYLIGSQEGPSGNSADIRVLAGRPQGGNMRENRSNLAITPKAERTELE